MTSGKIVMRECLGGQGMAACAYGVEAAFEVHFGNSATNLTLA